MYVSHLRHYSVCVAVAVPGAFEPCLPKVNHRGPTYNYFGPQTEPGPPAPACAPRLGRFSIRFQGPAGRIGSPREASGICRTNPGPAGWIRARKTHQGPREESEIRGTNQGPWNGSGPHNTNQGSAGRIRIPDVESGPARRMRAPRDEEGPRIMNQGPAAPRNT